MAAQNKRARTICPSCDQTWPLTERGHRDVTSDCCLTNHMVCGPCIDKAGTLHGCRRCIKTHQTAAFALHQLRLLTGQAPALDVLVLDVLNAARVARQLQPLTQLEVPKLWADNDRSGCSDFSDSDS